MPRPPQKKHVSPTVLANTVAREVRNAAAGLTGKERKAMLKWAAGWWVKALFGERKRAKRDGDSPKRED